MITKNTKFVLLFLSFCLPTDFQLTVFKLENAFINKLTIFSSHILNKFLIDINNLLYNFYCLITLSLLWYHIYCDKYNIFVMFPINFISSFYVCVFSTFFLPTNFFSLLLFLKNGKHKPVYFKKVMDELVTIAMSCIKRLCHLLNFFGVHS